MFFCICSIPVWYKTQQTCNRVVSEDSQKMCHETVDDSPATLKLIPDWFVTSKIIENLLLF